MKWTLACALLVVAAAATNPPEESSEDPNVFEGDMILTPGQRMAAMNGLDVDAPIGRGAAIGRQWPNGVVYYEIDKALEQNPTALRAIYSGCMEWTSKTCIQFKKRSNERAYVYFEMGKGCSSYVGHSGGRQEITLASGCWSKGIVAHEIGHALGFVHEQSRTDRDTYVTIMWDNIEEKTKVNFFKYDKSSIDSLHSPYDYGSIMHYDSRAFTKNGKPTVVPKKNGVTIGQRRGVSSIDALQMDLLYKDHCS